VCLVTGTTPTSTPTCTGSDVASGSPQTAVFDPVAAGTPVSITVFGYDDAATRNYAAPTSDTVHGSTLSIGKSATIAEGKSVSISGTLSDAQGGAIGSTQVQLFKRANASSAWTLVTAVSSNASGVLTSSQKPTANTQYEWQWVGGAGAPGHNAVVSGVQSVTVNQVITAAATAKSIKHGKVVKIYGTVSPNERNQTVVLQQYVSGKWKSLKVTAKIVKQKLPNGKTTVGYVLKFKPPKKGKYVLRASRAATKANGAGVSGKLTIKAT
jgi:predicted thioesterase